MLYNKNMKIIKISPRGYCLGVVNALEIVKEAIAKYQDKKIYLLGMIVHNQLITQALIKKGVILLDNSKTKEQWIEEIENGVVIISAHGVSPSIIQKAQGKGLTVINATCKYVNKSQAIIKEYLKKDYQILFIGKDNHPEALGIIGIEPKKIHLVSKISDLDNLKLNNDNNIVVTTQTTVNFKDTYKLFKEINERYPKAIIEDEICNATRMRQQAIVDLKDQAIDLLFVVGDPSSNNANKLVELAKENKIKTVKLITSIEELDNNDLINIETIAVTSAASTPTVLTNQIITYLENYTIKSDKPKIELDKII